MVVMSQCRLCRLVDLTKYLWFCVVFSCLLVLSQAARVEAAVSVALSDNLVILDSRARSGMIELVNLGADPTEFRLKVDESLVGTPNDASSMLRWAPARAQVPAHQTRPVRISARPTPELEPGEYIFRVGVTCEAKPVVRKPKPGEEDVDVPSDGIAVTIPIIPTLPITVYLRHEIDAPMVEAESLVLTPDDPSAMGFFPVRKKNPAYSFVGQVQVVEESTKKVINSGRLHIAQGKAESRVSMPRPETALVEGARYCVRIWDHFPGVGEAMVESCGR
jgi:hypothetical protein